MSKNKLFSGWLLVSDIDNTLLDTSGQIPERNLQAISYFIKNGGLFSIATARAVISAQNYLPQLPLSAPAILCNGALLYDYTASKTVKSFCLPSSAKELVRLFIKNFPELGIEISVGEKLFAPVCNSMAQKYAKHYHLCYTFQDLEQVKPYWNKVVFLCGEDKLQQVADFFAKHGNNTVNFVATCSFLYEMIPADINKATGLQHLAQYLHVPMKHTVAIGDYYNDLQMLQAAGIGAAVENAPSDVKAQADITVCHCDKGAVADLIEKLQIRIQQNTNSGFVRL